MAAAMTTLPLAFNRFVLSAGNHRQRGLMMRQVIDETPLRDVADWRTTVGVVAKFCQGTKARFRNRSDGVLS
jgi:hypothetical protein